MSAEPVTVEQRKIELRIAENDLGYLAQRWLQVRAGGDRRKLRPLDRELDEAQQTCRRAERRLRAAQKRAGLR